MGANSKIEWCDATFNPWLGCTKVSAGCDHCYAEHFADHRFHRVQWGPHGQRKRTSAETWRLPIRWNVQAEREGRRIRVFCASLCDWLDNKVPKEWRADLLALIDKTPHLDWLLLTKRIENYPKLVPWPRAPGNAWIGVTTEDQFNYNRRIKRLCAIAAPVRFISYEPAIGPLVLGKQSPSWVICGGESGRETRLMDPQWARNLRDECAARNIAYFFKQMTGKKAIPTDLLVRQFPRPRIRVQARSQWIGGRDDNGTQTQHD